MGLHTPHPTRFSDKCRVCQRFYCFIVLAIGLALTIAQAKNIAIAPTLEETS